MTYLPGADVRYSLNYSNAYGLQEDTHMTGDDYTWVATALYFGWLCKLPYGVKGLDVMQY
jgi:hypothetical protein